MHTFLILQDGCLNDVFGMHLPWWTKLDWQRQLEISGPYVHNFKFPSLLQSICFALQPVLLPNKLT